MTLYRYCAPTVPDPVSYEPSRALVLHGKKRVASSRTNSQRTAKAVGQFNREYSRYCGQPPMRDVRALRVAVDGERDQ